MDSLMTSKNLDPFSLWSIEPLSSSPGFLTAPSDQSDQPQGPEGPGGPGGPSGAEYSDSWEPVTFTGHSQQTF